MNEPVVAEPGVPVPPHVGAESGRYALKTVVVWSCRDAGVQDWLEAAQDAGSVAQWTCDEHI
eukprot:10861-Eustigmatos_ZCMA.PRE.1